MPDTTIIHVRDAYWTDSNTVYIGRAMPRYRLKASPWGNPFRRGDSHPATGALLQTNEDLVDAFAYWLWLDPSKDKRAVYIREHVHELRGKTLACWCKDKAHPNRPCHGDVLRDMAEATR